MNKLLLTMMIFAFFSACNSGGRSQLLVEEVPVFEAFCPPVGYEEAFQRANTIINSLSIDERIELIGGHNMFFIKGVDSFGIPDLYLSDATQGVHLRKDLDDQLEKSVAMPCPIMLASTWNRSLAYDYAQSVGEQCRAGGIAVLLGPGMNIYRMSQNGRNFEYFGEDPYLAARMIENYVVGMQSTGTIATLKHFLANNTDFRRRKSNSVVDTRTLHEIYLPAFKAGIDAGAMAVMTSYNQINGEWAAQSSYVINKLLRTDLNHRWLVMSDWWSIWDPEKAIKSGLDLDMPGHVIAGFTDLEAEGDVYLRTNAKRLLNDGRISEDDINRMSRNVILTSIAMGLDKREIKDVSYLDNYPKHEQVALQTAREGVVLLKNQDGILPIIDQNIKILATGEYMTKLACGGGSASVEGYDNILLLEALKTVFGNQLDYISSPTKEQAKDYDVVLFSIGTFDSEGWDKSFNFPDTINQQINGLAESNPNLVIIVNSGSGMNMSTWADRVKGILYGWYPGQNGNQAIAEILAGKVNPSGKLPITIEKRFEDSPAFPYIPENESLYTGWDFDMKMKMPTYDVTYNEGVLVGYRWYDSRNIEPLFCFGHGLSYATFEFSDFQLSSKKIKAGDQLTVEFTLCNTGQMPGAEVAQLYIQDVESTVIRPVKELKNFIKVNLNNGEQKRVRFEVSEKDLAFYDAELASWRAEPGKFKLMIGSSSRQIELDGFVELE